MLHLRGGSLRSPWRLVAARAIRSQGARHFEVLYRSRAELELLGSLRSLLEFGERTERDGVVQVSMTEDVLQSSSRYPRLHGQAEGKPYTLDDCFATRSSWPVFSDGGSQVISVGRILRGAIFEADEALEASAISFTTTYLNYWLSETGITEQWNLTRMACPS